MTIDFFQIFYEDSQKEKLYPFAIPYKNEVLTDYFENAVIRDLVPYSQADYISVCSWRLAQKRGDCYRLPDKSLTKEKILNADFDVAILTPRHPNHKPLLMASEWHRIYDQSTGAVIATPWDDAFSIFKKFLKSDLDINVPDELTHTIYENHFIARREIYQAYVRDCLKPSIKFITSEMVIFGANSGYIYKKRNQEEVKAYREKSGRQDWPIAPFILERLFSIFIEGKGYKVISL